MQDDYLWLGAQMAVAVWTKCDGALLAFAPQQAIAASWNLELILAGCTFFLPFYMFVELVEPHAQGFPGGQRRRQFPVAHL